MVEEKSISKDETAETDSESALVSDVDDIQVSESAGSVESGGENVESADSEMLVEEDVNEFGFRPDEMVFEDEEDEEDEAGDEDASPIEELVDEEVVVDNDLEMEWYILKVQVNRETSICAALQRRVKMAGYEPYFGDILVPTEDVREFTKSGKQRIVKRKLYPGYIVVKMAINDDTWFLVRETPGIGDFTGAAGKPAPLSADEIKRIIETTRPPEDEESEEPKTAIKFNVGDRVRVKEGYFQNYEGEVSNIDERNGRVTVMINIFGRPNPVELDHWQVEDV
jgi:transcriptional antiterminator NusG